MHRSTWTAIVNLLEICMVHLLLSQCFDFFNLFDVEHDASFIGSVLCVPAERVFGYSEDKIYSFVYDELASVELL